LKRFWDWTTHDAVSFYTFVLAIFTGVLGCVALIQLHFLNRADKTARVAAEAAKLNAEAVMAAEGAQLYPVIKESNLKDVFRGTIFYGETTPPTEKVTRPIVVYCFKNYGKTPAVLYSIMHNIDFFEKPSTRRTMHIKETHPIEVIGAGQESSDITFEMLATFNTGMAKSVLEYRSDLLFFGEAAFKDFFNREFRCIWECDGRPSGFRLVMHEQRPDPDKKK
jgi:hypothetical protein